MEKYQFQNDIHVFCVTACSFPFGVLEAHKKLHSLLPSDESRSFFGISYPNGKGDIIYKAAVEESYPDEGKKYGCEEFVIKKGEYISEFLEDWCKDESAVSKAFKKLLAHPDIDSKGYCLEMYLGERDMRCLVPLNPSENIHKPKPAIK